MGNSNQFDKILKDDIKTWLEEKGIDSPSSNQYGDAFLHVYLENIAQYLLDLDSTDIDDGIVDGPSDQGVDFVIEKENGYHLIQSKHRGKANVIKKDDIAGFFETANRVRDKEYLKNFTPNKLYYILENIKQESILHFYFVTNKKLSEQLIEDFERQKKTNENDKQIFELIDFKKLKELHKHVRSMGEAIPEEIIIHIERKSKELSDGNAYSYIDLSNIIDSNSKYKSVVLTMKGTSIKNLYKKEKEKLFNYNIRGYLGSNKINKEMKKTIHDEPEKFYYYNNGISCICTDMQLEDPEGKKEAKLICKNFQIINGAQTVSCIGTFRDEAKLFKLRILVRITKTEDIKKVKGLNRSIIRFNNSQTIIKNSDFRSNDEIQVYLENEISKFQYKCQKPYLKVMYARKRSNKRSNKKEHIFKMSECAKALHAFKHSAIEPQTKSSKLFDPDTENGGLYWKVFGEDENEVDYYTKNYLEETVAILFLYKFLFDTIKADQRQLKTNKKDDEYEYQSLLAKWHFLYSLGICFNSLSKSDKKKFIKSIHNGKISNDGFFNNWYTTIKDIIIDMLSDAYYDSSSISDNSSKKSFNFRNWQRTKAEENKLKDKIQRYVDKGKFTLN